MAEKLCQQWNDFQVIVRNAFGSLRDTNDFIDVTLACYDGRQIEAHKVVLAASSPFFQRILKGNKHSHPMIYMRGLKSNDLAAVVDFLYFGEVNVYQENLDSFLAIAEELQLKGLEGSKDQQESSEPEKIKSKENSTQPILRPEQIEKDRLEYKYDSNKKVSNALALPKTTVYSTNL